MPSSCTPEMSASHSSGCRPASSVPNRIPGHEESLEATGIAQQGTFVKKIPVELATRIFLECIPRPTSNSLHTIISKNSPDHTFRHQLVLGAVCRFWREIIWSNPRFWNTILLPLGQDTPSIVATILKDAVERSKELPLFIDVHYTRMEDDYTDTYQEDGTPAADTTPPVLASVVETLNSCAHRWSNVRIVLPKYYMSTLQGNDSEAPSIVHDLRLGMEYHEDIGFHPRIPHFELPAGLPAGIQDVLNQHTGFFKVFPRPGPRRLSLIGFHLEDVHISWCNLVYFNGEHLHTKECLTIFQNAPQLEECVLAYIPWSVHDHVPPAADEIVSHARLRHLKLLNCLPYILEFLACPNLVELWISMSFEGLLGDKTRQFIVRSGCGLREFRTSVLPTETDDLLQFLYLLPRLQSLYISDQDDTFFKRFGEERGAGTDNAQSHLLLPELRQFVFNGHRTFEWSSVPLIVTSNPKLSTSTDAQRPKFALYLADTQEEERTDPFDVIEKEALLTLLDLRRQGFVIGIQDTDGLDLVKESMENHGLVDTEDERGVTEW